MLTGDTALSRDTWMFDQGQCLLVYVSWSAFS